MKKNNHRTLFSIFIVALFFLFQGSAKAQSPVPSPVGMPASSPACHVLVIYDTSQAYSAAMATSSQGVINLLTSQGSWTNTNFFHATYAGDGFKFTVDSV